MTFKIDILLPYSWTKDQLYTYSSNEIINNGQFVIVPIKDKKAIGLVINNHSTNSQYDLKEIHEILDYKLNEKTIQWINIVHQYTLIPLYQILKMIIISYKNLRPGYLKIDIDMQKELNLQTNCIPLELTKATWVKLKKMINDNKIEEIKFPLSNICINEKFFSEDQMNVINTSKELLKSHNIILLQGATGSGKTNVYFEMLYNIWKQGKKILILVPEISLTSQLVSRFYERFGVFPYRWHNGCKQSIWKWASSDEGGVLVGVRSAIWAPFSNLGLIIVDEEHSTTYKQENGPRYNAKDIAILRAKYEQIPIVLASATPSLETTHNTNYQHLKLTRTIKHKLNIQLIKTNNWLSNELKTSIQKTLDKDEQVMLFLNKKGFATHIHCSKCANRLLCDFCTAGLIYHKNNYTHCSYCGTKKTLPKECPECKQEKTWKFYGLGIEKIQQEMQILFPKKKVILLSSDSIDIVDKTMKEMENNEINILIGTQILAQGCHFPNLTLVGIVQGDTGIQSGDIRNTEKMYQLISQVKGRCGRAEKAGTVIIQTNNDQNPLLQSIANENINKWIKQEIQLRETYNLPPFSRMIRVILGSKSEKLIEEIVTKIKKPNIEKVEIMGPAPTQLYKYQNEYRWSFLIKYPRNIFPQAKIKKWIDNLNLPKSIKLIIDVDPQSFF